MEHSVIQNNTVRYLWWKINISKLIER